MIVDFMKFCNNIKMNEVNDYFNCYSSFIMSRKDLRENVLNHRMNFLVSYYIQESKKSDKNKLIEHYIKNYKDNYPTDILNIQHHKFIPEPEEIRDDDVELHYKNMFTVPPPTPEEDESEIDKYFQEQEKKKEEKKIEDEYDDYKKEYYEIYNESDYYNDYEDDMDLEEYYEDDEDY